MFPQLFPPCHPLSLLQVTHSGSCQPTKGFLLAVQGLRTMARQGCGWDELGLSSDPQCQSLVRDEAGHLLLIIKYGILQMIGFEKNNYCSFQVSF